MTPEQFAYWLQWMSEGNPTQVPSAEQWKMIQDHLKTVFCKITPQTPREMLAPNTLRITPTTPVTQPLPSPVFPNVFC